RQTRLAGAAGGGGGHPEVPALGERVQVSGPAGHDAGEGDPGAGRPDGGSDSGGGAGAGSPRRLDDLPRDPAQRGGGPKEGCAGRGYSDHRKGRRRDPEGDQSREQSPAGSAPRSAPPGARRREAERYTGGFARSERG